MPRGADPVAEPIDEEPVGELDQAVEADDGEARRDTDDRAENDENRPLVQLALREPVEQTVPAAAGDAQDGLRAPEPEEREPRSRPRRLRAVLAQPRALGSSFTGMSDENGLYSRSKSDFDRCGRAISASAAVSATRFMRDTTPCGAKPSATPA